MTLYSLEIYYLAREGYLLNYYSLLNRIIDESKLSLKEISLKCEENGVAVTPSYISKLRSGKQQPASEEVNRAIAKACEFEDEIEVLLFESYKEKAPSLIKDFLFELDTLFRETTRSLMSAGFHGELKKRMEDEVDKMSDYKIISTSIDTLKVMNRSGKFVPQKMNNYKEMEITDDSMCPKIPKGSKVVYKITENVSNGDYIVVLLGEEYMTRRYIESEGKVFLLPEKKESEIVEKSKEDSGFIIVGKLVSVSYDIN